MIFLDTLSSIRFLMSCRTKQRCTICLTSHHFLYTTLHIFTLGSLRSRLVPSHTSHSSSSWRDGWLAPSSPPLLSCPSHWPSMNRIKPHSYTAHWSCKAPLIFPLSYWPSIIIHNVSDGNCFGEGFAVPPCDLWPTPLTPHEKTLRVHHTLYMGTKS